MADLLYSAKHKQHSLNFLIIVNLFGQIVWISDARLDIPHDQSHLNATAGEWRHHFEGTGAGILGDSGFNFNPQTSLRRRDNIVRINGFTPVTRRKGYLTPAARMWNAFLSQERVVVENMIGQIKKWKLFGGMPFRFFSSADASSDFDINHLFRCVCLLENWLVVKYVVFFFFTLPAGRRRMQFFFLVIFHLSTTDYYLIIILYIFSF